MVPEHAEDDLANGQGEAGDEAPTGPLVRGSKKKDATGVSMGELSTDEMAKKLKKKKRFTACALCKASIESTVWARSYKAKGKEIKEGPGCFECFKTWRCGNFCILYPQFQCYWSFCLSADPDVLAAFMESHKIRIGDMQPSCWPSEVSSSTTCRLRVLKNYVGLTRQEFTDKYKHTPESLSLKLQDLTAPNGTQYKGILMHHPSKPYTEYQLVYDMDVESKELLMSTGSTLSRDQASQVFETLQKSKTKGGCQQKVRLTKLTEAQIFDKIGDASERKGGGEDKAVDEQGEKEGSSDGSDESSDEEEPDTHEVGGAQAAAAADDHADHPNTPRPTKRPKLSEPTDGALRDRREPSIPRSLAPNQRNMSHGRASSVRSFPGVSPSVKGSGSAKTPTTAEGWIRLLGINSIWDGGKLGVFVRFARKFQEDHKDDDVTWFVMKNHLDMVDAATAVMNCDIMKIARVDLDKYLKVLADGDGPWTTQIKLSLINRRVKDIGCLKINCKADDVTAILEVCSPWCPSGVQDKFDPFRPMLYTVQDEMPLKSKLFRDTVINTIVAPLLKEGERGLLAVGMVCTACLEFFDNTDEMPDNFIEVVMELFTCWRGLLSLVNHQYFDYYTEAKALIDARTSSNSGDACKLVALVLSGLPFYKNLVDDFAATYATTKLVIKEYTAALKAIENDSATLQAVTQSLQFYAAQKLNLRAKLKEDMHTKLRGSIVRLDEGLQHCI